MSSWRRALDTWAIRRRTRALRVACRQGRREPGTCLCLLWVAFEEAHQKRPVRRGYGHRWESGASRMGELHHPVEDYGGPLGQGRHPTQGPVAPPAETTPWNQATNNRNRLPVSGAVAGARTDVDVSMRHDLDLSSTDAGLLPLRERDSRYLRPGEHTPLEARVGQIRVRRRDPPARSTPVQTRHSTRPTGTRHSTTPPAPLDKCSHY